MANYFPGGRITPVGLWVMEVADFDNPSEGLLYDHSGSANHLALTGANALPTPDTDDHKEGAASAYFNPSISTCWAYRTDDNLSANFPLKVGYADPVKISATFWFKADRLPTALKVNKGLVAKYNHVGEDERSWLVQLFYTGGDVVIRMNKGYDAGAEQELTDTSKTIVAGVWYHVGITYDDSTGAVVIRVWDAAAETVTEVTDTHAESIALTTTNFMLGDFAKLFQQYYNFDGRLDEVTIFDDILTSDEIDEIRQGIYGAGPSSSSSSSESSSSSYSSSSSSSDSSSSSFVPPAWPTLSVGVQLGDREEPAADDVTMPLANGRTAIRPRFTRRPHRRRVSCRLLSLADYLTLETFYLVTCGRSKYTFEFTDGGVDQTWLMRFDPDEPPQFGTEPQLPEKFYCEAVLLEETVGTYGPGGYGARYYDS